MNLYQYVNSSPIVLVDPMGTDTTKIKVDSFDITDHIEWDSKAAGGPFKPFEHVVAKIPDFHALVDYTAPCDGSAGSLDSVTPDNIKVQLHNISEPFWQGVAPNPKYGVKRFWRHWDRNYDNLEVHLDTWLKVKKVAECPNKNCVKKVYTVEWSAGASVQSHTSILWHHNGFDQGGKRVPAWIDEPKPDTSDDAASGYTLTKRQTVKTCDCAPGSPDVASQYLGYIRSKVPVTEK
jgi:hypothetical protein